jgi:hypothetical protein
MAPRLRILIAYYSYALRVEALAELIRVRLSGSHDVMAARIRPVRERSYWNWLARSFAPGATVDIEPLTLNLRDFDRVCLGFPKWTFSCPPVNRFLRLIPAASHVDFGLFMSYGGFDEDRFLGAMSRKVAARGRVVARLAVKRGLTGSSACASAVTAFCDAVIAAPNPPFEMKL